MLKKIPVVFATDENYAFYTCAAITSMAKSADCDTEYDVYILVNDTFPKQSILNKISSRFPNIKLKLLSVLVARQSSHFCLTACLSGVSVLL